MARRTASYRNAEWECGKGLNEKVCDFHEKRYMQATFSIGSNPDSRPSPGARLVEREVIRDGLAVWVEEWRITVSSVGELLELQSGLGVPVLLEGGRLTVMAEGA